MSKKKYLFIIILFIPHILSAQDIIVKKDGSTILSKVTKVGDKEVEYKKFNSTSDRIYSLSTSEIMAINYEDGDRDVFGESDSTSNHKAGNATEANDEQSSDNAPELINLPPAANNQQLIAYYNSEVSFGQKEKKENAKWLFPIMGMSESSILSNDELEMRIVPMTVFPLSTLAYRVKYAIELKNKTDKIVYVDLGSSFRYFTDGSASSYLNDEQTTVSHGEANGIGFSVFGIGLGGSTQSNVSTTYINQRLISIPPHSKKYLKEFKEVDKKIISDLDQYAFYSSSIYGALKDGGHIAYSENNSPYYARHLITYSTSPDFSTYSQLTAILYARYAVAGCYYSEYFQSHKKLVSEIQKYVTNFWENPYIIVGGCDMIPKPSK